ncbi:MAG TPA: YdeI/OmpD-associated family protein [Sediminibacterium sp.]|jgi:hypothetical protein|uniref:YdeI/OmpD-associated family protein n=2 Tax=Sediminibacterium sp. TaxID=1917865 RepID=UPI002BE9A7DC|nr:YdeI/OmpD-associated family protein [Sediminibacterium sp.]HQS25360.1 YdeI/OmpD-associated family protein [Sediminibacterium sp.]
MKSTYTLEKFSSGMHYIMVDPKIVELFNNNDNKRVVCKLNDQLEFHCAFMPKKEGGHYINIGATICKKLQLKEGSLVKVSFEVDNSDYQFAMPEEFSEVLSSDADANFIFHNLTEGNQRGLIYLVSQVKSSEKRIERALRIANRLKNGVTSPRVILK